VGSHDEKANFRVEEGREKIPKVVVYESGLSLAGDCLQETGVSWRP
jgi:hypothetical protein